MKPAPCTALRRSLLRRTKSAPRFASLWLACGALLVRDASADVFRYTDRAGRAHLVSTHPTRTSPPGPGEPTTDAPTPSPAAPGAGREPLAPPPAGPSAPYDALAREAAEANALPAELVLAVIETESAFDPRAVSAKGALGLMQLMPATAALLGVADPFVPRQNIDGGAKLLRSLLDEFGGHVVLALAAYNAGAAVVRRYGAIPPIAETQGYVASVLRAYQRYLGEGRDERSIEGPTIARPAPSPGAPVRYARTRPQRSPARQRSASTADAPERLPRQAGATCPGRPPGSGLPPGPAPCRVAKPPR